MVRFYMDENIDFDITHGLRLRNVDVLTVQEDGRAKIADPEVMDRATELGRIVFTHDDDLLAEATRRQKNGVQFSGVLFVHKLRLTVGECITDLEEIAVCCIPEEFENRIQYIPVQ